MKHEKLGEHARQRQASRGFARSSCPWLSRSSLELFSHLEAVAVTGSLSGAAALPQSNSTSPRLGFRSRLKMTATTMTAAAFKPTNKASPTINE